MIKEVYFLDYVNALLEGDKEKCSSIVNTVLAEEPDIKDVYVNLFQKAMYKLGNSWEKNLITTADEHLATRITEGLIEKTFALYKDSVSNGKTALISCIDKEYHELGAKMVSHIFELNGWKTYFLGASTPTKEIVHFVEKYEPDAAGLSFNFYMNIHRFYSVIDAVKKSSPGLKVIIGGQGASLGKSEILAKYNDLIYFESINELDYYLKKDE